MITMSHPKENISKEIEIILNNQMEILVLKSTTGVKNSPEGWNLQDGRRVRRGDNLPLHKYIRNTSTCGTAPTEHLLNAGRRLQTSQKARNSPTYLGRAKEKRKNRGKRIGTGPAPVGGSCEGGKVSTHFAGGDCGGVEGGSFGAMKESVATGVRRAKQRDSRTEDRRRAALTTPRGLYAHPPGGAGARSWDSGFGVRIPGRGLGLAAWTQTEGGYCATASGRESGKKSGAA